MKKIFILVWVSDLNCVSGFFCRDDKTQEEADMLNKEIRSRNLVWILEPNY